MDFIYEPLVIFNANDGGKPVWRLATSYKFSDDLKSITYELRPGVKWSDGQPLTSADVKYTIDLMLKNPAVDTVGVGQTVASVEAPSPTEVTIKLKAVNSEFPESLADLAVVPEHIWKDVADPVAFKNEKPVGSGPMTEVRRFTPQVYEHCRRSRATTRCWRCCRKAPWTGSARSCRKSTRLSLRSTRSIMATGSRRRKPLPSR
jgi:peptide/nickel transport system substrate-binding protein